MRMSGLCPLCCGLLGGLKKAGPCPAPMHSRPPSVSYAGGRERPKITPEPQPGDVGEVGEPQATEGVPCPTQGPFLKPVWVDRWGPGRRG